jgi:hypothetical protein
MRISNCFGVSICRDSIATNGRGLASVPEVQVRQLGKLDEVYAIVGVPFSFCVVAAPTTEIRN